ncbi:MAG: tetratricopeptide repeat protein [Saprospiraceae bacterium]|nr:tetratricopeptide repeat protein [Saprospiraceae bacterium]
MKIILSTLFSISLSCILTGQESSIYTDKLKMYRQARDFFDHNLYGPARFFNDKFIHQVHPISEDDFTLLRDDAGAMSAVSGLRLDLPSGENELLTFITRKYPDPSTSPAILELGSYYYNKKWFKKSVDIYGMMKFDDLPEYDMSEASFKKGYSHFAIKEFKEGKSELARTKEIRNSFYYPSNYYYGLCDYFTGNYSGAVNAFERVKDSETYRSFVPYYITQIYFAQNNSDKVISYGEESLKDIELRNRKEIRQLIGQSYFKKGNFDKALPHLEFYEANTDKLTIEEFYQLGFTQYQLKKYESAIENLRELHLLDTKLGQLVNYYLADCYYKTGDLVSARAFKKVSQMTYEKKMQEEATFNYGKLSAESGFEREAINTFVKIDKNSAYFKEADNIITDLLENMSDYVAVLQIIESIPSPTERIKTAYQTVALKYAMQLYNSGQADEALKYFEKSKKYNLSKIVQAQNTFWISQIQHEKGNYMGSIKGFDDYFDISNGLIGMPDESSPLSGHYTQGYNYLMLKDFNNAEKSFKNSIVGFNINSGMLKSKELLNEIWPDALVRAGDCLFKNRKYQEAITYYDQAIKKQKGSFVYAMYQKALIQGLSGDPYEKILTLKEIIKSYPTSDFADEAFMQLGDTYFVLNNIENAYSSFSDLVTKYKNSPLKNGAYLKLGLLAYNKGDLNTSISNYKAVFQNNPSAREAESALLGLQEIYIHDMGKAEEYVAFVSSLPGYKITDSAADSLAYMVGVIRYNEGQYDKAIDGFNNYISKYPNGINRIKAYYYRGESFTLVKKYAEALEDYERLIKLGNSEFYIQALRKSALISYNYTQTFDKSYQYYDLYYSAISDEDEKYKAALGALRSAFRIANTDGVKKYGNLVSNNKKADNEEKVAALYYLGKTWYKENNLENATTSFAVIGDQINNNQAAEARYLLAEILFKQNQPDKAEKQCNLANDKNASYPYWIAKSLVLMSDIYVGRKDLFNARAALEAIIENFKDDSDLQTIAKEKLKIVEEMEKQKNRIKAPSNSLIEFHSGGIEK